MTDQPTPSTLFDSLTTVDKVLAPTAGRVHRGGTVTEKKAAERVSFRSGSQTSKLLLELDRRGAAIPHDIYEAAGCAYPHVATTRLADLKTLGLVERTVEERPTRTDTAHVWRITDKGRQTAAELRARNAA